MSLAIHKFVTRCHASRRRQSAAALVDRIARERFADELAQYLGPGLSASGQIVRIRSLPVRVRIPAEELGEAALLRAWLDAFGRALFEALAYPQGAGPIETVRTDSRAQFLAMALRDIAGGAAERWQYAEFREFLSGSAPAAILALLCAEPAEILSTLSELDAKGDLELVLSRLDDLALETLFMEIAKLHGIDGSPLSAVHLAAAARWSLASPPPHGWTFDSRRQALRLFVRARTAYAAVVSPRRIFHALLALVLLLESPHPESLLSGGALGPDTFPPKSREWLPADVVTLFQSMCQPHRAAPAGREPLNDLFAMLEPLRPLVPSGAVTSKPAVYEPWIHSDCAGLFLLIGLIRPQDLDRYALAGLALAALNRLDPHVEKLDQAVKVFAGFTEHPDMARMRAAFQTPGRAAELDRMASELVLAFGSRIRGFRKATRQAVVRQFLARAGRIRVEEERVFVVLAPSSFHIALHISGMDGPVERVPWLGGKRVDFHLEGL